MIKVDIEKKKQLLGNSRKTDNFIVTYSLLSHYKRIECEKYTTCISARHRDNEICARSGSELTIHNIADVNMFIFI